MGKKAAGGTKVTDDQLLLDNVVGQLEPTPPDTVDRSGAGDVTTAPPDAPRVTPRPAADTPQQVTEPTSPYTSGSQPSPQSGPGSSAYASLQTAAGNLQNKVNKVPDDPRLSTQRQQLESALTNAQNKLTKNAITERGTPKSVDQTRSTALTGAAVTQASDAAKAGAAVTAPNPASTLPPAPAAFDPTKWADESHTTPKYVGGRILARGGTTADVVRALGAGWSVIDGQRIRDPQGRSIDVLQNFSQGQHIPQWNVEGGGDGEGDAPIGNNSAQANTGQAGAGGGNINALLEMLLSRQAPGAGQQTAGGGNDFSSRIQQMILSRLSSDTQNPSLNDPAIRSRLNAYTAASQGALNRGQSKFAERAYAEGTPVGSQDANLQGAVQNSARDEGAYAGNLMGEQLTANRDEMMQLLSLGAGILNADEERQLRAQIAAIDAQLRQQGLTQSNTHFYDQLGADIGSNEALLNDRVMSYLNA